MSLGSLRKGPGPARRARVRARVETLERRALMSAGDPDLTFGNAGVVSTDFGDHDNGDFRSDLALGVAVQSNGRVVTAGQSANGLVTQFAVARHLAGGQLDTSFDSDGLVTTSFSETSTARGAAVAIDGMQRIVVAGYIGDLAFPGQVLGVARYEPDGDLDPTFGNGGLAIFPTFADSAGDVSIVIDSANRVLLGFTASTNTPTATVSDMGVARLTTGGVLDTVNFGNSGVVTTHLSANDVSGGLAIDADGNVLQVGTYVDGAQRRLVTTRLSGASGARDTQYGTNGVMAGGPALDVASSPFVDVNGSLVVAGANSADQLTIVRVAADGSGAAATATALASASDLWSLTVQRDGKILVAGDNGALNYVVARFNSQFQQDTAFGDADGTADGVYTTTLLTQAGGIAIDGDGDVIVSGVTIENIDPDFFIARHDTDLPDEGGGGPGGVVLADVNARPDNAPYVVIEGAFLTLSGSGSITAGGGGVNFVQSQRRAVDLGSTPGGGTVEFAWDLDNDGEFDDSTAAEPVLNGAALDGPATLTIHLKVTDASNPNNSAVDTTTVQVNNVAPNASINLPAGAVEGLPASITATAGDGSAADAADLTYEWTVRRGATVVATGSDASLLFTPDDDGAYTVDLRVRDDDGGQVDAQTATLDVANANPTAAIVGGAAAVSEGATVSFTSQVGDVPADTLSFQWSVKKNGVAGYDAGTGAAFAFAPDDNGVYEVNLTVTDEDGGSIDAQSVTVSAGNVAPTPEATGDTGGVRGQERTLALAASDPSTEDATAGFTYTIDWADGSPVQTVLPGTTEVTHVFQNNGTYDVKVTAADKDRLPTDPPLVPQVVTMLTQSTAVQGGILTVSGSPNNDKLRLFMVGSSVAVENTTIGGSEYTVTYPGPITRIVVLGGDGNDHIDGSAMTAPMEVYGGAGDDLIETGSGHDIIVGGADHDRVAGNGGSDILIGGRGRDRLLGDAEEDILVGGYTLLDANLNALRLISAEWTSTRSFEDRVANIRGPVTGGVNGSAFLRSEYNAFDDGEVDALAGDAGRDWFFFNADKDTARDKVVDAVTTMEQLEEVNLETGE